MRRLGTALAEILIVAAVDAAEVGVGLVLLVVLVGVAALAGMGLTARVTATQSRRLLAWRP